ncbi:hypothetical protein [Burkholderia ubonensis]|uniref:hypothetical protein n=1 Tax=Burkholderia ubonensis TaxID=101571 RepID=UPI00211BCDF1|nr:hypothetical protein [Burkholderia ubonensis]
MTIWAITSTVSGNGDVRADPNRLVTIRDVLKSTSATEALREKFTVVRTVKFAEVLRDVSFAPVRKRSGCVEAGVLRLKRRAWLLAASGPRTREPTQIAPNAECRMTFGVFFRTPATYAFMFAL